MNILVNFVLNKNDIRSNNTRKTSETSCPRPKACCTLEKKKEEIFRNKEQPTEQSTVQHTVQSTEQSTVQSNYGYSVGTLAVLTISACVSFTYNKKAGQVIHDETIEPK